jgi:hypothetical protein
VRGVVLTQTLLDAVWGSTYGAMHNHLKVYIAGSADEDRGGWRRPLYRDRARAGLPLYRGARGWGPGIRSGQCDYVTWHR